MKKNKIDKQEPAAISAASSPGIPPDGMGAPPAVFVPDYSELVKLYGNQFGTSGYGVIHAPAVAPVGDVDGNETWFAACASGSADPKKLLNEGLEKLSREVALLNSFLSLARRDEAKRAITGGKILNVLQPLTKKAGLKWGAWCAEHITFMSQRNIDLYSRLADRVDSHRYTFLGIDRLDRLCTATASDVGVVEDPIGSFMSRHKIVFTPEEEFNLDEFQLSVDVALNIDRMAKNGLEGADIALVKVITSKQRKLDGSILQDLKRIKKSGGDINVHLRDLTLNRNDEEEAEADKRPKAFNNLSTSLIKSIEYIIQKPEQIDKIDAGIFQNLLKKLLLLEKAKFGVVGKKAA
jgi:hypothetical protein